MSKKQKKPKYRFAETVLLGKKKKTPSIFKKAAINKKTKKKKQKKEILIRYNCYVKHLGLLLYLLKLLHLPEFISGNQNTEYCAPPTENCRSFGGCCLPPCLN